MHYPVGIGRKRLIVGHYHKRMAVIATQVKKQPVQLLAVGAVEATRRLVGEHYLGMVDQRTRHRGPLPLATRQLSRTMRRPLRPKYSISSAARAIA